MVKEEEAGTVATETVMWEGGNQSNGLEPTGQRKGKGQSDMRVVERELLKEIELLEDKAKVMVEVQV